ncbi:MAG TPA: O-antigen ligase family protein, partial [Puia sp.]|nr:O-antigen ligase family protein [Puia sp.]
MERPIYINKYLPVAVLYFFFNSVFLPLGLLYTSILAPFFLFWIHYQKRPSGLWHFLTLSLLFACVHFYNGVNPGYYLKSYLILLATFIFCVAFYVFVSKVRDLRRLFKDLLLINTVLVLLALIFLAIPPLRNIVWYSNAITTGVKNLLRLRLFTYEASYYSTLLVPLVLYYCLKVLILKSPQKWPVLLMATIPILLSLSFGVILALIAAIVAVYLSDLRLITENRKAIRSIVFFAALVVLGLIILYKISPGNVVFKRLANVFEGRDTSFKGRTTDSFFIAWQIAMKRSIFFGCGPGQVKALGVEILRHFYRSNNYTVANTAIPNVLAETLAVYGLIGLFLRLGAEVYLFFRTKVYRNYYRLSLFLFIFIYQFTGSY